MTKYACDRKIAHRDGETPTVVVFEIEAFNGADASRVADELAYATAWNRGVYPNDRRKYAEPESWALALTAGV